MKKGIIYLIAVLVIGCASTNAQKDVLDYEVPENYSFTDDSDYKKYEKDILKCIDYLEAASVNDFSEKRMEINAYFLEWVSGTPDVSVSVNKAIMDLCSANKNFLVIFMGGWVRYSLQNNYSKNKESGYLAGIESIIKVYQKGNGVIEDQNVINIINLKNSGKLEDWVSKQVK